MGHKSAQRELDLIRKYDMLPRGGIVLCAVSGGADSIYLLDRLSHLRAPFLFGFTLIAAHYNHHLRQEESDRDEQFVRRFVGNIVPPESAYTWCWDGKELPIPPVQLIVEHGDVAGEAQRRRQGLEETARKMRYDFLYRTAREVGADVIATAHNADDNLETLLLHLVRGAGLQGLSGIQPRQGKLVRPLLATTRREIEEYLRLYGIPHVEDSSNTDESYSRNRMRRQALPILEGFNPALRENSIDAIRYLRADNDYLNTQAAQLAAQGRREEKGVFIQAQVIASAPDALAPRVVRQLLALLTGGCTDYGSAHLEAVVSLCRSDDPSAQTRLPGGLTARRVYDRLCLTGLPDPAPLDSVPAAKGEIPVPGTAWTLRLEVDPWPGLVVRARQVGDDVTLPGRPRRSLKKLFIDQKIPRLERDTIPVLADGDGVLAVAGLGPNTAHPRYGKLEFVFHK